MMQQHFDQSDYQAVAVGLKRESGRYRDLSRRLMAALRRIRADWQVHRDLGPALAEAEAVVAEAEKEVGP